MVSWGIRSRTALVVLMVKLALRMLEDSLCGCGHSALLAHGDEGYGEYETATVTCHACKVAEREKGERQPGVKLITRDLHDDPRDDDEEGQAPRQLSLDTRAFAPEGAPPGGDSTVFTVPPASPAAVMSLALSMDAPDASTMATST